MIKMYVFYNQKGKKLVGRIADKVIIFDDKILMKQFSDGKLIEPFEIMAKEESFTDPTTQNIIVGRFPSGSKLKIDKSNFHTIEDNQLINHIKQLENFELEKYSSVLEYRKKQIEDDKTIYVFQRIKKTAA